jgi:hypothetical protein
VIDTVGIKVGPFAATDLHAIVDQLGRPAPFVRGAYMLRISWIECLFSDGVIFWGWRGGCGG